MKAVIHLLFVILLTSIGILASAQSLPVGTPLIEEIWRRKQIMGERDINTSFTLRPLFSSAYLSYDSIYHTGDSLSNSISHSTLPLLNKIISLKLLPVTLRQQYNSHHPYGWNDGSMIQARGYQNQLSFGIFSKVGNLSIQVQPELVFAQNRNFATFSSSNDSIWKSYYYVMNRIDNPEKYGNSAYFKLFPGQSSIRLNLKKLSLGVSTENLWWGPGIRNSLIMSNNAPGFLHLSFNSVAPVFTPIGSFEWQVVSGILKNSGILPADTSQTFDGQKLYVPKLNSDRYLNGMIVTWQPKWTKGLHLGFTRVFYQYRSNLPKSLNGYFPVLSAFFKSNAQDENSYGRDQLLSGFFRLILPKEKAEFYGEYGRNDHSQNLLDLILEPEHTRAYIIGFKKIFTTEKQKDIELFMEITQLQNPATVRLRALEGWYNHYQVRHGYTNLGQVIGAGIGPGGNSQSIGLKWLKGINNVGVMFERVVHNNDFYYDAFEYLKDFWSHYVDLSLNFNKSWVSKRFIYDASLSFVKSYNYQWRHNVDVNNVHANLSVSYLF